VVDYLDELELGGSMSASYIEGKSWKIFLGMLLSLSLSFAACSKVQGPSEEGSKGVVEAPPVDPCEQPENLNNILCQWVATEIKTGGETSALQYDDKGRITQMAIHDDKGQTEMMGTLTYNDQGLWKAVSNTQPDPPDSKNFTEIDTATYTYDTQTGLIKNIVTDRTKNGAPNGRTEVVYTTMPNGVDLGILTVEKDSSLQPIKQHTKIITKDPTSGKVLSVDEKEAPPTMGAPPEDWSITKFHYYPDTGRLERMERSEQNCLAKSCMDPANNALLLANIAPTKVMVYEFSHDDNDRISGTTTTSDGEVDSSSTPPKIKSNPGDPPVPDSTNVCEVKYEIQTQAKIARVHPVTFFMMTLGGMGFDVGFNERDIFTSISCNTTGQSSSENTSFKWARLWQVIPGGQPPGGSNP
jgi:YD repeat-containing protein